MRDPFVAVDVATDLRALALRLRHSWESGLGGGKVGTCVRPVIEQSWQRMVGAGLDPDHLEPSRAFARDELSDRRAASPLTGCIDVLRHCLGGFAMDAEHVMVVVDGAVVSSGLRAIHAYAGAQTASRSRRGCCGLK